MFLFKYYRTRVSCSLLFLMLTISGFNSLANLYTGIYNVRDYGAKGDGLAVDSYAIDKAIQAAAAAGGGTVLLTAGNYLCGSIHLQSNINLLIGHGATIIAADYNSGATYDEPELSENDLYQDFGHSYFHNSLIWGENLENVSITGNGMIYGKGLSRGNGKGDKTPNKAISFKRCKKVLIRDITIYHGGWFGILATGVDNLTIDNIMIDSNRDGIDIDCCHYVTISNTRVNTPHDDGICLKSSFALNEIRSTENVTITNCIVSGYDEGSMLNSTFRRTPPSNQFDRGPFGRIKFGTESNGGFKNITISNIVFDYCRGLAIETTDGALVEDISISNITMRDIVNSPIYLRVGSRMRGPEGAKAGKIRHLSISNLIATNVDPRQASIISGVPGGIIEDINLDNIQIYTKGGGTQLQAERQMPEVEKDFPEPERHGVTSAYGFYIRHAKNINIHDVKVRANQIDLRPVMLLEDVQGAKMHHLDLTAIQRSPRIQFKSVADIKIEDSGSLKANIKKATIQSLR